MRVTLLAVGNTLMSDEGFGPAALEEVRRRLGGHALPGIEVDLVDGGVMGMKLLSYFLGSDAVIVLDAMDAGAEPGSLFRFTPEEAELEVTYAMSAHEIALPNLLETAKLLGAAPEVVIVACQVADISTLAERLTDRVAASVERAADLALAELDRIASETGG